MNSFVQQRRDSRSRESTSRVADQACGSDTAQSFGDRAATVAQRKLQDTLNQSPRGQAQTQLQQSLKQSPQVIAQAKLAAALQSRFAPVQQQGDLDEEELLQGRFAPVQRQDFDEEELLQGKFATVQRQGDLEEEELLQGRFATVQRQGDQEEGELLQGKFAGGAAPTQFQTETEQAENNTGMPDQLKSGLEHLSGLDLSTVRVHHNSAKPAQLNALAFAQGTDIHLGPGQEQHLPHEGWHTVQQMLGRVKPTLQTRGVAINDDAALEREADVMGAKALQMTSGDQVATNSTSRSSTSLQRKTKAAFPLHVLQKFADEHNKDRLKKARKTAKTDDMQLDHSVSQDTFKATAVTLDLIKKRIADNGKTLFKKTKDAYISFEDAVDDLEEAESNGNLKNILLNLRVNLTSGYKETTGNPGSGFDPQVSMSDDRVQFTDVSSHLLTLDDNARKLCRLERFLPKNSTDIAQYNKRVDDDVASALDEITSSLKAVEDAAEPKFDDDLWYDYTTKKNNGKKVKKVKKVKRVSADWITNKPETLGQSADDDYDALNLVEKTFKWKLNVPRLEITKKETELEDGEVTGEDSYKKDVKVSVEVKIPVKCWKHIYDRHTIDHFKGTVEAINTFWKIDPQEAITKKLLEPEVNLLIDRKLDLRKKKEETEEGIDEDENYSGYDELSVNEFVNTLFFQGTMEIDPDSKDAISITFVTKSIAPQDFSLADAIEPSVLAKNED